MNMKQKATAAFLSCLIAVSGASSLVNAADSEPETEPILVTGFEDKDVSKFSKRGDDDTSVIEASTEKPHSGDYCMAVTGRSEGWNGPSVSLAALGCEAGVPYVATAWVKAAWYNECKLSMQYTDADGEDHYVNLTKATSQGEWVQIPQAKFTFSEEWKNVQIYIEANDKAELYVDDFQLSTAPVYPIEQDIPGLKDVYGDYFKIGGAVTASELSNKSCQELVLKHYNSLTLGNELKPENMLDAKATREYYKESGDNTTPKVKLNGDAKYILNFCRDHNIPVRGHVLVWYSQTPRWFFTEDYTQDGDLVDKATMTNRMENYIKGVFEVLAEQYPDVDFYAWDVVNEALEDGGQPRAKGSYEEGNGSSAWVAIYGDNSFIEPAFKFARQYAPEGCKLYYNDYNEYMKVDAMLKLALDLKEKGYLDGLGLQSHLNVTNNATSEAFPTVGMYANALDQFCKSGLDIQITELDATYDHTVKDGEKLQADYYDGIMAAIAKHKDQISACVFWGTTDDQSWRGDRTPLLFDGKFKAKPAYYSITDGIEYTVTTGTTRQEIGQTTSKTTATETTASTGASTPGSSAGKGYDIAGDVNQDGNVTVSDAILLARIVAEDTSASVTDKGREMAELDGETGLTVDDLTALLKQLVGIK
ncbi:MAG: endo-1,4-beta-xylanase [Oscillospiraceae bacterium]|nr:endo-1,4-beta-xylanase [Oscillospiraceae bacterium]